MKQKEIIHYRNIIVGKIEDSSMFPSFKTGDIVWFTFSRTPQYIRYGEVYLVYHSKGFCIRRLMPGITEKTVTAEAISPLFGDIEISRDEIKALYMFSHYYTSKMPLQLN